MLHHDFERATPQTTSRMSDCDFCRPMRSMSPQNELTQGQSLIAAMGLMAALASPKKLPPMPASPNGPSPSDEVADQPGLPIREVPDRRNILRKTLRAEQDSFGKSRWSATSASLSCTHNVQEDDTGLIPTPARTELARLFRRRDRSTDEPIDGRCHRTSRIEPVDLVGKLPIEARCPVGCSALESHCRCSTARCWDGCAHSTPSQRDRYAIVRRNAPSSPPAASARAMRRMPLR